MRTPAYLLALLLALLTAAFVGFLAYYTYRPSDEATKRLSDEENSVAQSLSRSVAPTRPVITSTDPVRGDPAAPLTIVEFGDFLCPACAEAEPVLRELLDEFEGKIKLIWKDLPNVSRHFLAEDAAKAARCAQEQGKFWPYHDLALQRQAELAGDSLPKIAQELSLDLDQFSGCLTADRVKTLIGRTKNESLLLQVDATPYFFVGTQRFSGAPTKEQLREAISSHRN